MLRNAFDLESLALKLLEIGPSQNGRLEILTCGFGTILEHACQSGDHGVPSPDGSGQRRQVTGLPKIAFVVDVDAEADLLHVLQYRQDREVGPLEILPAAKARVVSVSGGSFR